MAADSNHSIVEVKNFVLATRDTGYRSTASAVAELVDNALEAKARNVEIVVSPNGADGLSVAVLDDGCGMDAEALRTALRFGGSGRFNQRDGMGRFGMGLPNSSLSQCRRVDVFTWRQPGTIYHSCLDLDDILAGQEETTPASSVQSLPDWAARRASSSGTLVIWSRCDRLDNQRPSTIARKLHAPLGRRFRWFLYEGVRLLVNEQPVLPIDPLFCDGRAVLSGASEPMQPLEYVVVNPNDARSAATVTVRFSLLPVEAWHDWSADEKRRCGVSGGAGVSIMRANREISYGWHFMGRRRRQNYDDWWRCEVNFEPVLDEWFGVTHSKQEINPTPELEAILTPDIVAAANTLNNEVQRRFASVRARTSPAASRAMQVDWLLTPFANLPVGASFAPLSSALSPSMHYAIRVERRMEPDFLTWRLEGGELQLVLNENHPFFEKIYQPVSQSANTVLLYYFDCLLLAYVRSEAQRADSVEQEWAVRLRTEWSNALAALLGQ